MTRTQNERFKAAAHDAVARIAEALDVDRADYLCEVITRFDKEGPAKGIDTARWEARVETKDFDIEGLRRVFLDDGLSRVNRMLADQGMIPTRRYAEISWTPYLLFAGSEHGLDVPFAVVGLDDYDGLASMGLDPDEAQNRDPDGYMLSVAREGLSR